MQSSSYPHHIIERCEVNLVQQRVLDEGYVTSLRAQLPIDLGTELGQLLMCVLLLALQLLWHVSNGETDGIDVLHE